MVVTEAVLGKDGRIHRIHPSSMDSCESLDFKLMCDTMGDILGLTSPATVKSGVDYASGEPENVFMPISALRDMIRRYKVNVANEARLRYELAMHNFRHNNNLNTEKKDEPMKNKNDHDLARMPYPSRFYTFVKTDKESGIKTLHTKVIFDDDTEVEVKGEGALAFSDGGKGELLKNAKEVGLMYAIVRRLCGIKNFRQNLERLMSLEVITPKKEKKSTATDADQKEDAPAPATEK